jgi:O-antigen/teichoic acid export membrane protein
MLSFSIFVPAGLLNFSALMVVAGLVIFDWQGPNLILITLMAVMVAGRLILSGWFKFVVDNHANVVATFGLQSLAVGIIFAIVMLFGSSSAEVMRADTWMIVTLVAEAIQLVILYFVARRGGFRAASSPAAVIGHQAMTYARSGLLISLLCLFAQTGLMGVTLSWSLLSPVDQGVFTIAYRVSQLILFPLIGASQLIIPLSGRSHAATELVAARNEVRNLLRLTCGLLVAGNIGFAILGMYLLDVVMHVQDPRAYFCTIILSAGNLITGLFGVGDQIMIAVGRHRQAFWVAFCCGGVLFPVLAALAFLFGYGVVGLACATAVAIALRAVIAYGFSRRIVDVPISVFDRI